MIYAAEEFICIDGKLVSPEEAELRVAYLKKAIHLARAFKERRFYVAGLSVCDNSIEGNCVYYAESEAEAEQTASVLNVLNEAGLEISI